MIPHHPEARFQTPQELVSFCKREYARLQPAGSRYPYAIGRAAGEPTTIEEMRARVIESRQRIEGAARRHAAQEAAKRTEAARQAKAELTKAAKYAIDLLAKDFAPPAPLEPPRRIIARVARRYGVTPEAILGTSHSARIVAIRWEAIRLVRRAHPHRSLPWIGQQFNRDHSTIMHALRKMGEPTASMPLAAVERKAAA
ncbi:helix-turn-helix domain-containing protein [Enterovirga sp. CN4-39]|uniref:helix-turn-helix domain-containing protein n=1 Tax=Enterovirga sp. CN4-39 TaxID=3400910 RepID=UPI003C128583